MQYTLKFFRSRNRYKVKREKKPMKLKHIIACIIYNINKTIIICLKQTEISWNFLTFWNVFL